MLRIRDVYPADPGSELFPSPIQGQKDSLIRIRIKNLSILKQIIVSKLSDSDPDF